MYIFTSTGKLNANFGGFFNKRSLNSTKLVYLMLILWFYERSLVSTKYIHYKTSHALKKQVL